MSNCADLWYVKLADGDVHRVNLDQLDDAFQAGHIDGATMVLASGSSQWTTLGELLGLDESENADDASDDDAPVQLLAAPEPVKTQPLQAAVAPSYASSGPTYRPAAPPAYTAPVASRAPAAQVAASPTVSYSQTAPSSYGSTSSGYGPPSLPSPQMTPSSYGPPSFPSPQMARAVGAPAPGVPSLAPAPFAPLAASVRPVSVDLGDFDPDAIRPKRRGKGLVVALLSLSVVGGLAAVAATRPTWARPVLSRVGLSAPTVVVAAAPPGTIEAPPPPVAEPPAPPQAAASPIAAPPVAPDTSPLSPHYTDRSTPDSQTKTSALDKPKPAKHAKGAAPHASKPKSTIFTTGGNKFDPLNSSI